MPSLSVLLYGRDPSLLQTRQLILQSVGYGVSTAGEYCEVENILAERRIDLLILCHTLSIKECECAMALTKPFSKLKTLAVTAGALGCRTQMLHEVWDAIEGPARFISKVEHLVSVKTSPIPG